jgi:molecular chaperone IbpA
MQSAIGFDELFRMAENFGKGVDAQDRAYAPYNIEKLGEDGYRITMALAGFSEDDVSLTLENDMLTVEGAVTEKETEKTKQFIHRGIATRSFVRKFQLADLIKVTGANFENGLLHIELEREIPEHKKPRQIPINGGQAKVIESKSGKGKK